MPKAIQHPLLIAFAVALALLIHSVVDFNLQIPANAATLVVILAMGWLTRWLGHHAEAKRSPMAKAFAEGPADIVSQPQERAGKHLIPSGTRI